MAAIAWLLKEKPQGTSPSLNLTGVEGRALGTGLEAAPRLVQASCSCGVWKTLAGWLD
jgi:hypothetical protein